MHVVKVEMDTPLWYTLAEFAQNCSWVAGEHLAQMLRERRFIAWEAVFAALKEDEIVGYCTLLKTDYYPENRYWPWISTVFVQEQHRGQRISGALIEQAAAYACACGFSRVYIPAEHTGLYEKYGFRQIDTLRNYGGDEDFIFARDI